MVQPQTTHTVPIFTPAWKEAGFAPHIFPEDGMLIRLRLDFEPQTLKLQSNYYYVPSCTHLKFGTGF